MNASQRQELIAAALRLLSAKDPVRTSASGYDFINALFGVETVEQRQAREIDETATKVVTAAKKFNVNRKFKKIIQHV